MSFAGLHEKYDDLYSPRFSVRVGREELTEATGEVTSVSVDTTVDGADRFSFSLIGVFDQTAGRFRGVDWDRFAPGTPVDISIGYGNTIEPVHTGRITAINPDFPVSGGPSIEVSGYGLLHDLAREKHSEDWDETTHSAVAREIASRYDFQRLEIEDTRVTHRKVIQEKQNDLRFLAGLADQNGYETFVDRDTFHFRPPAYDADPPLTLRYGESLASFSPEFSSANQVTRVEVRHYDPKQGEEIVGSAARTDDAPGAETGSEVLRVPVRSEEEADRVAEAALERIAGGLVRGTGETVGLPDIKAGTTIRLEGLGDRFDKTYYVEQATHRIGTGGYQTSFEVKERTI